MFSIAQNNMLSYCMNNFLDFYSLQTSTQETGIFKQLRDRLNSNPKSRCDSRTECIHLVVSEENVAYGSVRFHNKMTVS